MKPFIDANRLGQQIHNADEERNSHNGVIKTALKDTDSGVSVSLLL